MANKTDGMNYAPSAAKPEPVVGGGEFKIAAGEGDKVLNVGGQVAFPSSGNSFSTVSTARKTP